MSGRSDRAGVNRCLRTLAGAIAGQDTATAGLGDVPDDQVPGLITLARAHGVEAWLAGHMPSRVGPWQPLAEQRIRFGANLARVRATVEWFAAVAERMGCEWVVVKGIALAEDVYRDARLRFSVDVDVLVDPAAFRDVLEVLQRDGWRLIDRNWPLLVASRPGQLRLVSPSGSLLDLHWHLLNNPALRGEFPISSKEILARRRVLPSGVPALDAVDQLVHLAIHGALSGANRLSWLADAGLAARSVDDWSAVDEVAAAFGAGPALSLILLRAHRWLATPVPSGTADGAWPALCRAVDRISPLAADPDRPAAGRSFARSVRATPARSLAEFARHGLAFARTGARRRSSPLADPANPASPLHIVEDPRARERYLKTVVPG